METVESFLSDMRKVFADVPRPARNDITMNSGADCETREAEEILDGRHWSDITLEEMNSIKMGLHDLTPAAFRYFLPAYISASLSNTEWGNEVQHSLDWYLSQLDSPFAQPKIGSLTDRERNIVRRYLELRMALEPEPEDVLEAAVDAYNKYWRFQ